MKIVILDRASIGADTPLYALDKFGDVVCYDHSSPDEAKERAKDADIIIINKIKVTKDLMEYAKNLKLVCVFATGFDNIDITSARELGIGVCTVPGYSTASVVLYTIATVLGLSSKLYEYNAYVRSGEYTASGTPNLLMPVFHEISGKKWGIIGYGNIGKAVAKVAQAMGAKVIVNKRTPIEEVECVDIETICRESDIITIHCPLNDRTRSLIDSNKINIMKPSVIIVNEARGAVLDENAVACAIEEGKIAAFGCDVYSTEPFGVNHPFNRIKSMPNVLLTPHSAWGAYEARERCINVIADNIDSFISGKTLNRVDK